MRFVMSYEKPFTKENLDYYLKELAKEFRKRNGKAIPAEIILVGGASILINYGFREMTYDMDAVIRASSTMKESINFIGDRFGLPNGWLNTDITNTKSYSPKLLQYSKPYRTYSNVLNIRTISAEYLIAMKLVSGRQFKNDLSDIIGILHTHDVAGQPISNDQIGKAVNDMYGSWKDISTDVKSFLDSVMKAPDLEDLYQRYLKEENENHDILIEIHKENPKKINKDNINDILSAAKRKKQNEDLER